MGTLDTELRVNRRNTTAFIGQNPTPVALERAERVRTAAGGYKDGTSEPVADEPQVFRIIGISTATAYTPTTDGTARRAEFVLLGEWDADVQVNDSWTDAGRTWRVGDVIRTNGYETRAVIFEKGK